MSDRYHLVTTGHPSGGYTEFTADSDDEAIAEALRGLLHGERILCLDARLIGNPDRVLRSLAVPAPSGDPCRQCDSPTGDRGRHRPPVPPGPLDGPDRRDRPHHPDPHHHPELEGLTMADTDTPTRPPDDHVVTEWVNPTEGSTADVALDSLPEGFYVLGSDLDVLVGPFPTSASRHSALVQFGRHPGEWTFQVTPDGAGTLRPNNFMHSTKEWHG